MKLAVLPLVAAAALGCGPAPKKPTTGTANLHFAISANALTSSSLVSPVMGTFYGNIFLLEDVGVTGPRSGAVQQGSLEVPGVDLRGKAGGQAGDQTVDTGELLPNKYVVLGFLDVNGNGAASRSPDPGDPVTLALTNQFEIVAGQQARRVVIFELIYN